MDKNTIIGIFRSCYQLLYNKDLQVKAELVTYIDQIKNKVNEFIYLCLNAGVKNIEKIADYIIEKSDDDIIFAWEELVCVRNKFKQEMNNLVKTMFNKLNIGETDPFMLFRNDDLVGIGYYICTNKEIVLVVNGEEYLPYLLSFADINIKSLSYRI